MKQNPQLPNSFENQGQFNYNHKDEKKVIDIIDKSS